MSLIDSRETTVGTAASALEVRPQADADRLRALAAQFEALLLGQMMRQMRASMLDEEDRGTGFGSGPLSDQIFTELSTALSRAGGLGLAEAVRAPLLRQGQAGQTSPVDAAMGLAPAIPDAASDAAETTGAAWPGRISSNFGWRRDPIDGNLKFHKGADIAMPIGQDVPAARSGQVSFAGQMAGYGLTVVVDHGDGVTTRYAHLSTLSVGAGDRVTAGQVVARSGATGRATAPHLHFEVLQGGAPVDPSAWLRTAAVR